MVRIELDEKLILKIAAGDRGAFEELYRATDSAVYGLALSILRNRQDAEDIMHDTYIKLFQNACTYQPQGKPLAWILTITRNLCFNRLRERRPDLELEQAADLADKTADTESSAENRICLDAALEHLDEEERQIVLLHAMAGWKHRETASFLGLALSTVLSKYSRALKKMKAVLEG